ncbi:hypothetical protein [Bradyrhizobium sp. HKCCYLS20291]|uniref:hypothetical protein n=1 Tax=Bradyrhizobium sp. HKCCYLS20291 TaxID=3420766 RepID=UPI003EC10F0E
MRIKYACASLHSCELRANARNANGKTMVCKAIIRSMMASLVLIMCVSAAQAAHKARKEASQNVPTESRRSPPRSHVGDVEPAGVDNGTITYWEAQARRNQVRQELAVHIRYTDIEAGMIVQPETELSADQVLCIEAKTDYNIRASNQRRRARPARCFLCRLAVL